MFAMTKIKGGAKRVVAMRCIGIPATAFAVAVVFALTLVAPVTIDADSSTFKSKTAVAGNGNGNGGGGGSSNGGGGGSSNAGGGDNSNAGGGDSSNAGGNGKGHGKGNDVASTDKDRALLLVPLEEAITIAQFTTRISKRYPADELFTYDNSHQSISFFSEFQGMSGKEITHRWFYGDNLEFEASFKIRADRWRVWSTQLLPEDKPGKWRVEIMDETGEVLANQGLNYAPKGEALAAN